MAIGGLRTFLNEPDKSTQLAWQAEHDPDSAVRTSLKPHSAFHELRGHPLS